MSKNTAPPQVKLAQQLRSRAFSVLSVLASIPSELNAPVSVEEGDGTYAVSVTVTPRSHQAVADLTPNHHGRWLSSDEELIVERLGTDTVQRTELAKRCRMPYDPKFKTLVANLINRAVLEEPDDTPGVRVNR
jgi:hypothetical protein